jgi:hypothetical protein
VEGSAFGAANGESAERFEPVEAPLDHVGLGIDRLVKCLWLAVSRPLAETGRDLVAEFEASERDPPGAWSVADRGTRVALSTMTR